MNRCARILAALWLSAVLGWLPVTSARAAPAGPVDFNRDVRPILSENCFYCHGQDPNHRKADLRLDDRKVALELEAIVPKHPAKSSVVERIESSDPEVQMPPPKSHRTLTAAQKETLKRWIAEGAEYQPHWAYLAPVRPPLPAVKQAGWIRNAIDAFILARLEAEGIAPSPKADATTLLRRVTLDLTGLPPTPEEVAAYLADHSPDAYERIVERLLASPAYGERMALPWLDAARFADSNGFQQDGDTFQWVWRDWVVRTLNANMPFDQFSIEQLAGDLLPNPTDDQRIATGFNRNHLLNGEGGAIPEEQRFNVLFDRVDTTATNWLALTLACSQCHDHKYDPLTQRDYYGLLAAFNNLPEGGTPNITRGRIRLSDPVLEFSRPEDKKRLAEMQLRLKQLETEAQSQEKFENEFIAWRGKLNVETAKLPMFLVVLVRDNERDEEREKTLTKGLRTHFETKIWPDIAKREKSIQASEELKQQIKKFDEESVVRVMVMQDSRPRETHILDRGDYLNPKEKVAFATPAVLPPPPADAPKNRLGFARWLFQPNHPLTARVQVNRMWQLYFGQGLVKTVEDFGVQSEVPVHYELLDWLAVEFRDRGWNMKDLHRLIVTSATYRQSSRVSPEHLKRDPENRFFARAARFRLPSLLLRDLALASCDLLDRRVGGVPVYPYQPDGIWETLAITKERDFTYPTSATSDFYRRSLYTFWRRTVSPANMFDSANRQTCRVRTSVTSTPLHALTTLNDVTWVEAARVLAEHAIAAAPNAEGRVKFAFQRVLSREPNSKELALLGRMLTHQQEIYAADTKAAAELIAAGKAPRNTQLNASEHAAITALCLALFNLDQSLTRE